MGSGILITLEGIEGCGKTTQAGLLRSFLTDEGYRVILTREPGGSSISEKIRRILLDTANSGMVALTELLLYEASRSQHVSEVIRPALASGACVICDRFYDASTAYQGYGRGIETGVVTRLNLVATGGLKPDLTIVLDLPVEEGLKRLGRDLDRIEGETPGFHERVRKGYMRIADSEPERVRVIDASGSIEETFLEIKPIVEVLISPRKAR
jgi:dTMP kinase